MTTQTYHTPTEAAEYLRSSTSTLAKRRLLGSGPTFVRIGRAIRYRKSDLDRWMNGSTTTRAER
jgi:excisionase family DNA binding protein